MNDTALPYASQPGRCPACGASILQIESLTAYVSSGHRRCLNCGRLVVTCRLGFVVKEATPRE